MKKIRFIMAAMVMMMVSSMANAASVQGASHGVMGDGFDDDDDCCFADNGYWFAGQSFFESLQCPFGPCGCASGFGVVQLNEQQTQQKATTISCPECGGYIVLSSFLLKKAIYTYCPSCGLKIQLNKETIKPDSGLRKVGDLQQGQNN